MTLEQLQELIKKYLAMGVTVILVLSGGGHASPSSRTSPSSSVITLVPAAPRGATAAPGSGTPGTAARDTPTTGSPTPTSGVAPTDLPVPDAPVPDTPVPDTPVPDTTAPDTAAPDTAAPPTAASDAATPTTTGVPGAPGASAAPDGSAAAGSDAGSAAATLGWGTPNRTEDFAAGTGRWTAYNGAGHAGRGRRSPSALTVANGVMTITGTPDGTTEGLAWNPGQRYGRWEVRARVPAGDPSYHAVLLLWPDAENWPAGGEVDFMEIADATRQGADMFVHYGANNAQKHGSVTVDATQWHDWALDWTPRGITGYVDARPWFRTTDAAAQPPGPMHLAVQLDWFPQGGGATAGRSQMQVQWVRQYAAP